MRLPASLLALAAALVSPTAPPAAADPVSFAKTCADRADAAEAASQRVIAGDAAPWLFLKSEVRHLSTGPFWEKQAADTPGAPVPAIVAYDQALKALGVTLVVVPVPAKGSIYPDKLVNGAAPTDPAALEPFLAKLTAEGVAVVDLERTLRETSAVQKAYCETDAHWSPWACRLAAVEIARHPAVKALFPTQPSAAPAGEEITITGDLAEDRPDAKPETLTAFRASSTPVPPDDASPILLMGDSHTAVFSEAGGSIRHHTTGAGVRDHLQALLGHPLAVITSAASGADAARSTALRRAAANAEWWPGKKLVIWLFSARELTQGKWRQIPAQPKK